MIPLKIDRSLLLSSYNAETIFVALCVASHHHGAAAEEVHNATLNSTVVALLVSQFIMSGSPKSSAMVLVVVFPFIKGLEIRHSTDN